MSDVVTDAEIGGYQSPNTRYDPDYAYTHEVWSPLYHEYPYDSDGGSPSVEEEMRQYRRSKLSRSPAYYRHVIRHPDNTFTPLNTYEDACAAYIAFNNEVTP